MKHPSELAGDLWIVDDLGGRGQTEDPVVHHADRDDLPSLDQTRSAAAVSSGPTRERQPRAERLRIPGLDPARTYRMRVRHEIGPARAGWILPPWLSAGEVTLPGSFLVEVGIQLPTLWPMQALLLHLESADAS